MTKVTETRIYIQARNENGDIKNLSVLGWSKVTGKQKDKIRREYHMRVARGYTMRQVVGYDETPTHVPNRQKKINNSVIMTEFLKTRLVN